MKTAQENAVLAMVTHDVPRTAVYDLAYPVHVNGTNNTVVATLDTGAQCSAIRLDVAKAAGLDWTRITNTGSIRGVSGEPLQVHRRTRLCLHAGGLTTSTDAYVIEGIRPQVILGLPWI